MVSTARFGLVLVGATCLLAPMIAIARAGDVRDVEPPFLAENQRVMDTMMVGMAVKPSGDTDRDFAAMMIPHHEGAIGMAVLELRYGRNEQLRRIAHEVIVDQQQEIAAMRLAVGEPLPPSAPAPTQGSVTKAAPPDPAAPAVHTQMKNQ